MARAFSTVSSPITVGQTRPSRLRPQNAGQRATDRPPPLCSAPRIISSAADLDRRDFSRRPSTLPCQQNHKKGREGNAASVFDPVYPKPRRVSIRRRFTRLTDGRTKAEKVKKKKEEKRKRREREREGMDMYRGMDISGGWRRETKVTVR